MDLSQFKVKSFVIGLIVLGILITLASWGISRLYMAYSSPNKPKIITVSSATPTSRIITSGTSTPRPITNLNQTYTTTPTPTAKPAVVPQTTKGGVATQPNTGSDTVEVQNPGIAIYNPTKGSQTSNPLKIAGSGNVTSKTVTLQVLDQNRYVLGTTNAGVCYGTEACQFEAYIGFDQPQTTAGYLYAYTVNSLGQKTYEVLVPISFN